MEYLVERFDERTRQAFSWTTIFFQLFTGRQHAVRARPLRGLRPAAAPGPGRSSAPALVILAYCVVGGLWAVVITDFLQAAILMPFTVVMAGGLARGWAASAGSSRRCRPS